MRRERLNPFLLDKLAELDLDDDAPMGAQYGLSQPGGMTLAEYKRAVLRDVSHLLNTHTYWPQHPLRNYLKPDLHASGTRHGSSRSILADYPRVLGSVLYYGMPDTTGLLGLAGNPERMAKLIHKAMATFEPRIRAVTLSVTPVPAPNPRPSAEGGPGGGSADGAGLGRQRFLVEGDLLVQARPERFSFMLEADLLAAEIRLVT